MPQILEFTGQNTLLQAIRQFFDKQEEDTEHTDLGEEKKKSDCYLSQPIGSKPLNHFTPEGNSE